METNEKTKNLVNEITRFANSFSIKFDEFNECMSHEHRTLQQSFTKLVMKWLEFIANENYATDDRNKASQKIARELLTSFQTIHGENSKPSMYLPLI